LCGVCVLELCGVCVLVSFAFADLPCPVKLVLVSIGWYGLGHVASG